MQADDTDPLFSRDYAQARTRFLAAAQARGLAVESHVLDLPGAGGEALAIDVVREGAVDAPKMLLVISGVHGAEGFAGSAIQTGWLRSGLGAALAHDVAVVHLHAVNPHGFSHLRRVTQENVDLNRNFVDFDAPLPKHETYAAVHDHLLPREWPPSAANEAALADYAARHGERGLQRAAWLGQYTHADGVCFGGTAPTWSHRTVRAILRQHALRVRLVASIDIHTGLGPYGVGERIFACHDPGALEPAQRWWGPLTSVHDGSSNSVPITGPIQSAVEQEFAHARHVGMCLEFGTRPMAQVSAALRGDHWLYRHGAAQAEVAAAIRQALRDAFYPDEADWKQAVSRQGLQSIDQAVRGLAAAERLRDAAPP
jgi:hypothetical protein